MNLNVNSVKRVALLSVLLISASAAADPGAGEFEGLAGLTFDVTAEVTYSDDPALPAGTVFENCYFFNEDGVWFDPLYPDFGVAIPGYWVQHSMLPKITYTATVSETAAAGGPFAGLMLTQNGVVTPGPDNGNKKLLAYTTVYFGGWPIVEVVSIGRAVDDCPYF